MHPIKSQPTRLDWWFGLAPWFKWVMFLDILAALLVVVAVIAPYDSTLEVVTGVPAMIGGVAGLIFTIMGTIDAIDATDSYTRRRRVERLEERRKRRGLPRNNKRVYDAVPRGEYVEIWMGTHSQGWSRLREYHAEEQAEAAHEYWSSLTASPEISEGHTSEAKALANSLTGKS